MADHAFSTIGSIGQGTKNADVVDAGCWVAKLARTIGIATTTASGVVTGVTAGTARQPIRTTRTSGIVRARLTDRTTSLFGYTDRTRITAGVIAALFGGAAAIRAAVESGRARTGAAVPDLLTGTLDRFGRGRGRRAASTAPERPKAFKPVAPPRPRTALTRARLLAPAARARVNPSNRWSSIENTPSLVATHRVGGVRFPQRNTDPFACRLFLKRCGTHFAHLLGRAPPAMTSWHH